MFPCAAALWAASTFAVGAVATPSLSTTTACQKLSSSLPDRVSQKLTFAYTTEVNSYWSTALHDAKPACLVLPESSEEVSIAVKILNKYPDVQFAVKSGGHTPNKRHSSIQDGVLISTKNLAGVTYDEDEGLAYVKPGGEWNDVIGPLDEQGVAVVGGRLGLVGVGGYLLQGGISFLSAQYGLAADNIVGWEMVASNGSIVNVKASGNPDLAVALRGSGSQLGIVTQFTIKAVPIANVWGGMRIYSADKQDEIFDALHSYIPGNADDTKSAIILTDITAVGGTQLFLIFYFYDGPEPPTTGAFAKFLDIDSTIDSTSTQAYSSLLKTNGEGASLLHSRISFRTYTIPYYPNNSGIYKEISDEFRSLVDEYLNPLRLTAQCSIDYQPFPAIIGKHSDDRGGNAMGISGSDPDRLLLEIQCSWSSDNDDDIFQEASAKLTEWLEGKVQEWSNGEDYYLPLFMNDAGGDQNVTGTYREYEKLKKIQKQLDPAGFFPTRGGGFVY